MKKFTSILTLCSLFILVGCSSNIQNNDEAGGEQETPIYQDGNAIVVYFSATGNTENVANYISEHIEAPLYELEPVDPYTSEDLNYSNQSSRVVLEHNDPNRHVELETVTFKGFDEASYIFLGAPVWWQELSWVVDDFVELNDFTNKTIIPFATSSSSSYSIDNLKELAPEATWFDETRFSSRVSESQVIEWVDSLGIDFRSEN